MGKCNNLGYLDLKIWREHIMKKKITILLCSLVVVMLAVSFAGCKDDPKDPPVEDIAKDQSTTINLCGKTRTAIVKGYMTNAQWSGVATKIENRLNADFNTNVAAQDFLKEVFGREVTFIVEVSPTGYTNLKTIGDGKTIYIALSAIDTTYLTDGVGSISSNGSTTAKVHDNSYQKMNQQQLYA